MMKLTTLLLLLSASPTWAQLSPPQGLYDANGKPVVLGQTSMAGSLPIAISANQTALPVSQSGTWSNNISGTITATQATGSNLHANIDNFPSTQAVTQSGNWTVLQSAALWNDNVTQLGGTAINTGAGATSSGTARVAANLYDSSGSPITSSSNGNAGNQLLHNQTPDTTTASAALGALNTSIGVSLTGLQGAGFQLAAGTLIGTIVAELSYDGGITYPVQTLFYSPANLQTASSIIFSSSNTLTDQTIIVAGGASHARIRVSAYTSGTANATMRATMATPIQINTMGISFSVAMLNLSMATAGQENPLLYIKNPSTNTKTLYAQSLSCGIVTANRGGSFDVYANPTVTANGTALNIVNRTIGSPLTSVMNLYSLPTVSSPGSLFGTSINAQNSNSVVIADSFNLKIPPGSSILITGNPSSNATGAYLSFIWSEY